MLTSYRRWWDRKDACPLWTAAAEGQGGGLSGGRWHASLLNAEAMLAVLRADMAPHRCSRCNSRDVCDEKTSSQVTRISCLASAAARPRCLTTAHTYSVPLPSASTVTSAAATAFFLQKPSRALLGEPSLPNATCREHKAVVLAHADSLRLFDGCYLYMLSLFLQGYPSHTGTADR